MDGRHRRRDKASHGRMPGRCRSSVSKSTRNLLHRSIKRHVPGGHQDGSHFQVTPDGGAWRVLRRWKAAPGGQVRRPRGHCDKRSSPEALLHIHQQRRREDQGCHFHMGSRGPDRGHDLARARAWYRPPQHNPYRPGRREPGKVRRSACRYLQAPGQAGPGCCVRVQEAQSDGDLRDGARGDPRSQTLQGGLQPSVQHDCPDRRDGEVPRHRNLCQHKRPELAERPAHQELPEHQLPGS